jgi:hypothetical protein
MNLTLSEIGTTNTLTFDRLIRGDVEIVLDQKRERRSFQRTVEEVSLTVSDLRGQMSDFFSDKVATSRFQLLITDNGDTLFLGEIKNDSWVSLSRNRNVKFTAFSHLKFFYDRSKVHQIMPAPRTNEQSIVYTTVEYILNREFIASRRTRGTGEVTGRYSDLFTKIIVADEYKDRPIRGWANASTHSDPSIGDNGRYRELAGSTYAAGRHRNFGSTRGSNGPIEAVAPTGKTTAFDLLTAFALYYNAEFYIDYDQKALVMHSREGVINATPENGGPHDLDKVLMDDPEPEIQMLDDEKYDYVRVIYYNPPPSSPVLSNLTRLTTLIGLTNNISYVVTEIRRFEQSELEFETPGSPPLFVDVRSILDEPFTTIKSVIPLLKLPASQLINGAGAYKKRLYRTKQGGGDFYLLREYDSAAANQDTFVPDSTSDIFLDVNTTPPPRSQTMAAWIRKNESTGLWESPIPDTFDGANTPEGNVLNLIPSLSFRNIHNDELKEQSTTDVSAFFGLEAASSSYNTNIQRDFEGFFISKYLIRCAVKGTKYLMGSACKLTKIRNPFKTASLVIKRCRGHISPSKQYTELEVKAA